ncbi:MAG TPA: hypothetical protein VMD74_04915 [Candidatus Methylomirabilis sp.]|nr:hypothetical protein [Candidatus Methylomirabilis sp.]
MESVLELVSPEKAEGFQLISRNSQNGLPEHYHRCVRRGNATLHLNFYGLTRSDLGKLVNFRTVIRSVEIDKQERTYVDFYKMSGEPMSRFELCVGGTSADGDYQIEGTQMRIRFAPRRVDEEEMAKAA